MLYIMYTHRIESDYNFCIPTYTNSCPTFASIRFCPHRSIKHLQTTPSSTPSTHARSPSPHAPPKVDAKKEKKRKELSSGRQKKFHRHFQQVAADEHVINCTY